MKNNPLLPDKTYFITRHKVSKENIDSAKFDMDQETKSKIALDLANFILDKKAFAIQTPMNKLHRTHDIEEFLADTINQDVEYSLQLIVMTHDELMNFIKRITFRKFRQLKKENR